VREALALYGRALEDAAASSGPAGPLLRYEDGASLPFPVGRYLSFADPLDRELLDGVQGPVLDVGCGPGRHLRELTARGVYALGVDLSSVAVELACSSGARAMVADIFGEVPGAGSWRTALLLDGNIGIGGDPVRLLTRLRSLLDPDGVALVELDAPGAAARPALARLELAGESSDWFAWARVAACQAAAVAGDAGMTMEWEWSCAGRWFARLRPDACA
jgi:SAM-dependent methyltransferase